MQNAIAPQQLDVMVQDEFQTKEVSQPVSKKRQNRCGDDVNSSYLENTKGQQGSS